MNQPAETVFGGGGKFTKFGRICFGFFFAKHQTCKFKGICSFSHYSVLIHPRLLNSVKSNEIAACRSFPTKHQPLFGDV